MDHERSYSEKERTCKQNEDANKEHVQHNSLAWRHHVQTKCNLILIITEPKGVSDARRYRGFAASAAPRRRDRKKGIVAERRKLVGIGWRISIGREWLYCV